MILERQITDIRRLTLRYRLVDQDGQTFTSLPPGATLDWSSSNPAVSSVQVLPGGLRATCNSGSLGAATITATPGGTIAGSEFGPHSLELTVVESAPASAALEIESEEDEPVEPQPPV